MSADNSPQDWTTAMWWSLHLDKTALLERPGTHHKSLIHGANSLHRAGLIDRDDLCELLELADAALAYAVETLLDVRNAG
jgi:hypothetical protein